MSKVGEIYHKSITDIFTGPPDKVLFQDHKFTVKKTWKIGDKKDCDMTRKDFIQELEQVNIFDVNQYRIDYLKLSVKPFIIKNDLQ